MHSLDGFRAEGVDVVSLGVAPTPMVAFEAQRLGALGAVVSASHNPYHDNGIKLFALGGLKLTDDVEQRIEAELESDPCRRRPRGCSSDAAMRATTGRTSTMYCAISRAAGWTGCASSSTRRTVLHQWWGPKCCAPLART